MEHKDNLRRVRFLDGERIFLTPQSEEDFDDFYGREHDPDLEFLDARMFRAKSRAECRREFDGMTDCRDAMYLSIIGKETGEYLGAIVLFRISYYQRTACWGIKLDKKYWQNGYGSEAGRLLLRYVFEDMCFRKLRSGTHSGNPASVRLQEKLGFVREGVMRREFFLRGKYLDALEYGLLKEDYEKMQTPGGLP